MCQQGLWLDDRILSKSWNALPLTHSLVNFHPLFKSDVQCHFSGATFPDQSIFRLDQYPPYGPHPLCTLHPLSVETPLLKRLVQQTVNSMYEAIGFCVSHLHTQETSINFSGLNDFVVWNLQETESIVGLKSLWGGETGGS